MKASAKSLVRTLVPSVYVAMATFAAVSMGAFASACTETDADPATDDGTSNRFDAGSSPDAEQPITCPTPKGEPTKHSGDIAGEEVWTAEGSPHIVEYDVNVRNGAKLTIEPCAEVRFAAGQHLKVASPNTPNSGTLIAEGTAQKPIRFSGNEGARWASLYVQAPGTARLAYVTLENGGGGDFEDGSTIDVLGDGDLPADAALFVDHVTVKGSLGTGVWMHQGAAFAAGSTELTITSSGSEENPFPIQIDEHAIDAFPTGKYTGNRIDEILLRTWGTRSAGDGLTIDATLHERGVPYRIGTNKLDSLTIGHTDDGRVATLTIEAGTILKFHPETVLRVQSFVTDKPSSAAIRALGTAEKPVVFTSAAASPKAGDWRGFWFGGIASDKNKLDHVRIEYAGASCGCSLNTCSAVGTTEAGVIFTAPVSSAFITNSTFKEIAGHGIAQGFDGTLMNFRPTNTFEGVAGCIQTMPRGVDSSCPKPQPACDGL